MTDREIRELISDAMQFASVPDFGGSSKQAEFLAGLRDVTFQEVEIDSLAAMELCIAIETDLGVSLAPAELPQIGSLNGLVKRVQELQGAGIL